MPFAKNTFDTYSNPITTVHKEEGVLNPGKKCLKRKFSHETNWGTVYQIM